ncbi:MAG: hypothetical protein VYB65_07610 [Myxococcota bacterium]|nr:hypothetical protein [Myxococcota bacterium]
MRHLAISLITLTALACGPLPDENRSIEIEGVWATPWGDETITDDAWQSAAIISFDNASNMAITQAPADDEFNPSAYSKIRWTEPVDGRFFYCTVAFGQATEQDAVDAEDTSDANDLSGEGCGGFAWTLMREPLAIAGSWASEFSEETITSQSWDSGFGVSAVRDWDNADQWVVTQNAADAEFGPNTFNAVFWTLGDGGVIYHCTGSFGHETLDAALTSVSERPDATQPEASGCGDFAWTKLEPR